MSKSSAIALGAGALGFLIAGPAGFAAGITLGGLVGRILFPQTIRGPRLSPDDLKVQISTYASPIAWCWGWVRLSGNMVWATDIVEWTSKKKSGIGSKTVTYTYFGNFTIMFCRAPVGFVKRIWADGKLIYEANPDTGFVESKYINYMTFRFGAEDQTASAMHESFDGAGNTPHMRGVFTIDFEALPLKDFGNHLPSISCEFFAGDAAGILRIHTPVTQAAAVGHWDGTDGDTTNYWDVTQYIYNATSWIDYTTQERVQMVQNARLFANEPTPNLDPRHTNDTINHEVYNSMHFTHMKTDGTQAFYGSPYPVWPTNGLVHGLGTTLNPIALHRPGDPDNMYSAIDEYWNFDEDNVTRFVRTNGQWKADPDHTNTLHADNHFDGLYNMGFDSNGDLIIYGDNYDAGQINVDFVQIRDITGNNFNILNTGYGMGAGFADDGSETLNVPSWLQTPPFKQRIPSNKMLFIEYSTAYSTTYSRSNPNLAYHLNLSTGAAVYMDDLWDQGVGGGSPYDEAQALVTGTVQRVPRWQAIYYDPWSDKIIFIWRVPGEFSDWGAGSDRNYFDWVWATIDGDLTGYTYHGYLPFTGMRTAADARATSAALATFVRDVGETASEPDRHHHDETFGAGVTQMQMAWFFRRKDVVSSVITNPTLPALQAEVIICDYSDSGNVAYIMSDVDSPHPLGYDDAASYDMTLYNMFLPYNGTTGTDHRTDVYFNPVAKVLTGEAFDNPANFWISGSINGENPSTDPGQWVDYSEVMPFYSLHMDGATPPDCVDLSVIVSDICEGAGMTSSQYNVSALTDCVIGYKAGQQINGRSIIEPLQDVYFFDGIETDGALVFKYRDASPIMDIPEYHLAARGEGDQPQDLITSVRQQEIDLPARVFVKYEDFDDDHNILTQQAFRANETQNAEREVTIEVPVVMTAAKAKEVAELSLYLAWQLRTTYEFQLPRAYYNLDAGDIITTTANNIQYTVYITEVDTGADGLLKFKGLSHDTSVFLQSNESGTNTDNPPPSVSTTSPAVSSFIDGPLLRSSEDGFAGFYIAGEGTDQSSEWPGGVVYESTNDSTFDEFSVLSKESTMGTALTALPDHQHTLIDRTNTLQVDIGRGSLVSVAFQDMLEGANAAMLGDELIAFQNASLVSPGVYDLTNIMRGGKGTRWATGTHSIGDRFVLLVESDLALGAIDTSDIGLLRYYKVVSEGLVITDVSSSSFTPQSNWWKPLAPWRLRGSRDGSSNLTIDWNRCARVDVAWKDGIDVPLDEDAEEYEIDILDTGVVVRTIVVTDAETASYTAAEQTTDFGSAQSAIDVEVYQISSRVGRGYAAAETI